MSILKELTVINEEKGKHTTFQGWKRAVIKKHPNAWFDGDKDICNAMVGPQPYKRGETKGVGEWDGAVGELFEDAKSAEKLITSTDKKVDKQNKEKPRKVVIGKQNELVDTKDETGDICEAITELFSLNSDVLLEAGEQLRNPVNKLSMSRVHVAMMSPSDKSMKHLKDKVFAIRNEDPIVDFMLEIMGVPKDGSAIRIRNGFMKYIAGSKMLFIAKFKSDLPGEKNDGLESEQVKSSAQGRGIDEGVNVKALKIKIDRSKFPGMSDSKIEDKIFGGEEGDDSWVQNQRVVTVETVKLKGSALYIYPAFEMDAEEAEDCQVRAQEDYNDWQHDLKIVKESLSTIKALLNEEKFSDMLDRYCEQENLHSFEGPRGVRNLGYLVKVLGYNDLDSFFEDNSGALEKVCEWIGDMSFPEWVDSLKQEVKDADDDDEVNELLNKFIDENKLWTLEGPRGLKNVTKIVGALDSSYRSFDDFLSDNSGALEAIIEWIKKFGAQEWKDQIKHELHPE